MLRFYAIASNERQPASKLGTHRDVVLRGLGTGQLNHLPDRFVNGQPIPPGRRLFDEIPDPVDDLACPIPVLDDVESWAIEAVNCPMVATRFACANSICTSWYRRSFSWASASARLRSVRSSTKETPRFPSPFKACCANQHGQMGAVLADVFLLGR